MKKILISLIILFTSFGGYTQGYFVEKYNTIITSQEEYLDVDTYVEFNVYNTSDIVIHFETLEPIRYVQDSEVELGHYEGIPYQIVRMKLANGTKRFIFSMLQTKELLIMEEATNRSVFLLNTEENKPTKTFNLR